MLTAAHAPTPPGPCMVPPRPHLGTSHGTFHEREILATSLYRQLSVASSNQVYLAATSPPPR